jgi:hypothetical protein
MATRYQRLSTLNMNTLTYAAIASVVALVPIFYALRRNRGQARAPPVTLELFPATHVPTGPIVVVTGGSGFLGRRIIELLLQEPQQYRIVVLDMLLPVVKHASVTYIRGDICDPAHVETAFKGATAVLHVASIIPSLRTQASPIIERVNVGGTRVVIDACKVRLSTATCYCLARNRECAPAACTIRFQSFLQHAQYVFNRSCSPEIALNLFVCRVAAFPASFTPPLPPSSSG